jgi:hypothetical protein
MATAKQTEAAKRNIRKAQETWREVLAVLRSQPVQVQGGRFAAKPRVNVPESAKPTPAQRQARARNIKKAQTARSR